MSNRFHSKEKILATSLQAVAGEIILVYISPHTVLSYQDMQSLVDQLNKPTVLLGDFNAHSMVQENNSIDRKGKVIEKLRLNIQNIIPTLK